MDYETLKGLRLAHPFRPFTLVLRNGKRHRITDALHFGLSPRRDVMGVADGSNWVHWIALNDISAIREDSSKRKRPRSSTR